MSCTPNSGALLTFTSKQQPLIYVGMNYARRLGVCKEGK